MTSHHPLIVVGAGISGLSMTHYARCRGLDTLLLEAGEQVGGCLKSFRLNQGTESFWLELGAHTLFNSYGNLLAIMEQLELLKAQQQRAKVSYKLWLDGEVKSVFSRFDWLQAAISLPRVFTASKAQSSMAEYYSAILGHGNYRSLFRHAFNAVICQPADEFPADLLFRRKPRRKDVLKSFTLAGGLQRVAETIAAQPGLELRRRTEVVALETDGKGFIVHCADSGSYTADYVVLATSVAATRRLLAPAFPALAELLAGIGEAAVETVGVVVEKDATSLPPVAGLIAPDHDFYSAVSRDIVPDARYRGFTFHFKPARLDITAKLERIRTVLGIGEEHLMAVREHIHHLPTLRGGHHRLLTEIERELAGKRLGLTGNYFSGVSIEDCVTRSRQESERLKFGSAEF